MCMMGAVHSRFENVFFLNQTLSGVLCTQYALQALPGINHRYNVYQVWIDEYNREEMGI
jgi:tRNA(Arg) A34 adenosine deaminase TadA